MEKATKANQLRLLREQQFSDRKLKRDLADVDKLRKQIAAKKARAKKAKRR